MATIKITVNIEITEAGGNGETFLTVRKADPGGDNPRYFHRAVGTALGEIGEQMESQVIHRYGSV